MNIKTKTFQQLKLTDLPRNTWNEELKHKDSHPLFQREPNCQKNNLNKGSSKKTAKEKEPHLPTRTRTQTHHLEESKELVNERGRLNEKFDDKGSSET